MRIDSAIGLQQLRGKSVRGAAAGGAGALASFLIAVVSNAVLARMLGPTPFGLVAMVTGVTALITLLADFGLPEVAVQADSQTHEDLSTHFWFTFSTSALLTILIAGALSPVLAWFYGDPELLPITAALSVGFLFRGTSRQHIAILRRQLRIGALKKAQVLASALALLVAIFLAFLEFGYWALVARQVLLPFVVAVGVWIETRWVPGRPGRLRDIFGALRFGRGVLANRLSAYTNDQLQSVFVGWFFGAHSLGLFNRGSRLYRLAQEQLNAPLEAVAVSTMSRLKRDAVRYRRTYTRMLEKLALVSMVAAGVFTGAADWIVHTILGARWDGAVPFLAVLSINLVHLPVVRGGQWLYISAGNTDALARRSVFVVVVQAASIVAGVPWGPLGVAYSYTTCGAFLLLPWSIWHMTLASHVRAIDVVDALIPGLIAGPVAYLVLAALRAGLPGAHSATLLVLGVPLACVGAIASLLLVPAGRRALADIRVLVREFRTG